MEKQVLVAKYNALVSEWNTIFLASAVLFGCSIVSLIIGFVFVNTNAMIISLVLMLIFGAFELRSRKFYVESKDRLEKEMGLKKMDLKELVEKGLIW